MRLLSLSTPMFGVAILSLHCTATLASSSSSYVEHEFDVAKNDFYSLITEEVTKELAAVDGILAQFSMGYSR